MAIVWDPGLWEDVGSSWYALPGPTDRKAGHRINGSEGIDFAEQKVEGADGTRGISRTIRPVTFTIAGAIQKDTSGVVLNTEAGLLAEWQTFRTKLQGDSTNHQYWFMIIRDTATTTYRFFKQCITVSFGYNLAGISTKGPGIPYNLVIRALDPVLYVAAAGNLPS